MKITYAPRALRDLQGIADYLSTRSPSGTRQVLAAIKSSIETLEYFPRIGVTVNNAGHPRLPVLRYPYVVFYRIATDELIILHVRHSSRKPVKTADNIEDEGH